MRMARGWTFTTDRIDADLTAEALETKRHEKTETVALIRRCEIKFAQQAERLPMRNGDLVVSFGPAPDAASNGDAGAAIDDTPPTAQGQT